MQRPGQSLAATQQAQRVGGRVADPDGFDADDFDDEEFEELEDEAIENAMTAESLEELDLFIAAMRSIAKEVEDTPDIVKTAPHSTRISRLDEVQAARKPILRWKPTEVNN